MIEQRQILHGSSYTRSLGTWWPSQEPNLLYGEEVREGRRKGDLSVVLHTEPGSFCPWSLFRPNHLQWTTWAWGTLLLFLQGFFSQGLWLGIHHWASYGKRVHSVLQKFLRSLWNLGSDVISVVRSDDFYFLRESLSIPRGISSPSPRPESVPLTAYWWGTGKKNRIWPCWVAGVFLGTLTQLGSPCAHILLVSPFPELPICQDSCPSSLSTHSYARAQEAPASCVANAFGSIKSTGNIIRG